MDGCSSLLVMSHRNGAGSFVLSYRFEHVFAGRVFCTSHDRELVECDLYRVSHSSIHNEKKLLHILLLLLLLGDDAGDSADARSVSAVLKVLEEQLLVDGRFVETAVVRAESEEKICEFSQLITHFSSPAVVVAALV